MNQTLNGLAAAVMMGGIANAGTGLFTIIDDAGQSPRVQAVALADGIKVTAKPAVCG